MFAHFKNNSQLTPLDISMLNTSIDVQSVLKVDMCLCYFIEKVTATKLHFVHNGRFFFHSSIQFSKNKTSYLKNVFLLGFNGRSRKGSSGAGNFAIYCARTFSNSSAAFLYQMIKKQMY